MEDTVEWRIRSRDLGRHVSAGRDMEWKMEWNGNFGMEYERCRNGMVWKISRME